MEPFTTFSAAACNRGPATWGLPTATPPPRSQLPHQVLLGPFYAPYHHSLVIPAPAPPFAAARPQMARRAFAQRTVPPHDPDATTPHGAYHLELLLGDGQGGTRVGALKKRIVALEAVVKDPEVGGRRRTRCEVVGWLDVRGMM